MTATIYHIRKQIKQNYKKYVVKNSFIKKKLIKIFLYLFNKLKKNLEITTSGDKKNKKNLLHRENKKISQKNQTEKKN